MSQDNFICEYCNKQFSSRGNLNTHKKNAKYCLEQQRDIQDIQSPKYQCNFCEKILTSKYRLNDHFVICKVKREIETKKEQEKEKTFTDNLIAEKDKIIQEMKQTIQDLQNKLYELASRPQVVNSNSNNNNTNHTNKIMNLQMITQEHLNSQAQHLTLEHIKKGAVGYGEYFLDHPLKDRVVCTDFSRRKIKYKNENGEIITDPELTILSESLFKSIRERNRELAMQYTKELTERFANKNDPAEMSYFMDLATKFSEQDIAVGKMLDGVRNDMFHDIIRHICSKSMQQQ